MKTPDKIYVFQHGINAFDPLWHFTKSKEKNTEFHEYIRKDALLEWAKRMLVCFKPGFDCHETLKVIVEHIESL